MRNTAKAMRDIRMSKPTQSAIRAMIAAQAPDQTAEGMAVLESKLAFMAKTIAIPKHRAKKRTEEEDLQIWLCEWLDMQPRILYWANPKQVFANKATWQQTSYLKKLQRMGAKKGLPDLCMLFKNKHGVSVFCFAELKRPLGTIKVSDEQSAFLDACCERGGYSAVVRSLEDMKKLLEIAGY